MTGYFSEHTHYKNVRRSACRYGNEYIHSFTWKEEVKLEIEFKSFILEWLKWSSRKISGFWYRWNRTWKRIFISWIKKSTKKIGLKMKKRGSVPCLAQTSVDSTARVLSLSHFRLDSVHLNSAKSTVPILSGFWENNAVWCLSVLLSGFWLKFRKKLSVVCLSGHTKTRQRCPDFSVSLSDERWFRRRQSFAS